MEVAKIFNTIKKTARNFFVGEDIVQILKRLQKFNDDDLKDCNGGYGFYEKAMDAS